MPLGTATRVTSPSIPRLPRVRTPLPRRLAGSLYDWLPVPQERRNRNAPVSWIWSLGSEYQDPRNADGPRFWCCGLCSHGYRYHPRQGLFNMRRHLLNEHPNASANAQGVQEYRDGDVEGWEEEEARSSQTPMESIENSLSPASAPGHGHMSLVTRPNAEAFRKALLKWVVNSRVSFQNVTSQAFIDMILVANPTLAPFLRSSGATIARWVKGEYIKAREKVKDKLQSSWSKIHLSFDGWTSPNGKGLLAVVAHWLTPQLTLDCALLTIREIDGAHGGEHIAAVVCQTIDDFDLRERFGVFVADNATNNDSAVGQILQYFGLPSNEKLIKRRRSRCLGHIINLAAKAFIFGQKVDAFEAENAIY